ncbi:MAG: ATP-binding protein [candidate division Zixibacteria bacterium]|nr:ATP-binding protein [candidate division Zixibacteria bacterium]
MKKPVISGNRIVVPSDQEYLSDVDAFLEGTLRGFGGEESIIADIAISVSELVNNAMLHGNKSSEDKSVTVEISRVNGSVRISVSDEGGGFDPSNVADPLAEENLLKEVGRGLFIVRSLMDKVDIEATDKGTAIIVTKALRQS